MIKKTKFFFLFVFMLCSFAIVLNIYLVTTKTNTKIALKHKQLFVQTIGLPDLAFCSNDTYLRHRSLSNIFAIYNSDEALKEFAFGTFVYSNIKVNYEK
jgi:hypothetical protein